ncbi:FtsX-like permease family protein [Acidaminobacter sp. JC074]|uniref:ABC transporter permease n=1 Tax=Acidaminobacter sp. JC074 TaxID=2530199 RepID=UPI001F101EA1|nr:ABC transporter permease [Acidaminobacter sp. JC074]MCH4886936.1 FtsX-like permease family protein [Acidaminobacter sp. JC074]
MNISESIKMAVSSIKSNKMRSLLTMLGIIIGISSVIALVTLGNGQKSMMTKEFSQVGANRATIYVGNYSEEMENMDMDPYMITNQDLDMINRIYGDKLEGISPSANFAGSLVQGRKTYTLSFKSVAESYNKIENMTITGGRFFSKDDVEGERQVAVVDQKMVDDYYKGQSPIGQMIQVDVNGQTEVFRIIGIYTKQASSMERSSGNSFTLYTPLSVGTRINEMDGYESLEANVKKGHDVKTTMNKIVQILARKHDAVGKNMYQMYSMESQMKMMNKFTGTITLFVSAIAGISLLVGGIGIMNIMLVSVTERTREIGIRKAIGAKKKDILSQFMIESIIVSGIGGIIGIICGIGLAYVGTKLMKVPLAVDPKVVLIAVGFSALIGVFFGMYPANKAAKLNTIDALRYE